MTEPIGPIVAQAFAICALVVYAVLCGERETVGGVIVAVIQIMLSVVAIVYWSGQR